MVGVADASGAAGVDRFAGTVAGGVVAIGATGAGVGCATGCAVTLSTTVLLT